MTAVEVEAEAENLKLRLLKVDISLGAHKSEGHCEVGQLMWPKTPKAQQHSMLPRNGIYIQSRFCKYLHFSSGW